MLSSPRIRSPQADSQPLPIDSSALFDELVAHLHPCNTQNVHKASSSIATPFGMAGYYYQPPEAVDEEYIDYAEQQPPVSTNPPHWHPQQPPHPPQQSAAEQLMLPLVLPAPMHHPPPQTFYPPPQFQQPYGYAPPQIHPWATPIVPSNDPHRPQDIVSSPPYTESMTWSPELPVAGPSSSTSLYYLSPDLAEGTRSSRAASLTSNTSSVSPSDVSETNASPKASEMARWGHLNTNGTWSCAYPGCYSRSTFSRGCDLRKHYKRHTKTLFCRHKGCPQATEGGFSSKKDRARHEAKHNPAIACEFPGCGRMFSRMDNMVRYRGLR